MIGSSFGDVLEWCARSYPGEIALIQGDRQWSYAEMFDGIRRTGRAIRNLGLGPGDRVAFVMSDSPDLVQVMWGAFWSGVTVVPLNARLSADDHVYMVSDSAVKALFFDAPMAERGRYLLNNANIEYAISADASSVPDGGYLLSDLQAAADGTPGAPEVDPDGEVLIQYTGGTTGFPKGARHSHRTMLSALLGCVVDNDVRPGEVHAHVAPLTHAAMAFWLPVWIRGGTNIVLGGFNPQQLLESIPRFGVTSFLAIPTMLYVLLDTPGIEHIDLSSVNTIAYGAAPIGRDRLARALEVFGPVFIQGYGQTEAPMQITVLTKRDHIRAKDRPELLASCGRPCVIADVQILDDDNNELPVGEVGEICVRGSHVTLGYVNKPEETESALAAGWLHTGDLGRRDADGYVYIVDRKKDMIISGGFNVFPKEVEQTLFAHPSVADVCVIGVPDDRWGEAVKAIVVQAKDSTADEQELIAFVKERKGSVLAPKSVDFVERIPLTSVGKHDKVGIRHSYWQGRDSAII